MKVAKAGAGKAKPKPAPAATGAAAVRAYIDGLPGWKKALAKRIDALIEREVPNVRRAIKWNMPFYASRGRAGSSGSRRSPST